MRKLAIVLLALLVAAPLFAATPTITKLADVSATREGAYTIGNPYAENYQGSYDEMWFGEEEYAVLVNPTNDGCTDCGTGFVINEISMLLGLPVDTNLEVQGVLFEAVDNGSGVLIPGEELYATPVYVLDGITEAGTYFINLPAESPCAVSNENYFVSFRFVNDDASYVGIAVDDSPTVGYGYNEAGFGWLDLVDYFGLVGDVFVYADIDCCESPVATESSSFGGVKSLYR